ncbi:g11824 [Coccomyxa viridis]|uniref:G11824 protein n=1 Tax=Coccomyxa viridis TaxID=1274662 RepID=A0ABP1GBG4_9CHLO
MTVYEGHGDYRDTLPTRTEDVAEQLASVVQDGKWTFGLFECWGPRERLVKKAVHVPCCPSFRFNPFAWRGICFGRWARTVHALNMGREYSDPFRGLGRSYPDEIGQLCGFVCMLGCAFSLGIGQAISICGDYGVNFAACFTCHSREKLRRRFKLPPVLLLPPGIDDCIVHFLCTYCASHQEMREAVVRGLDGPGLSPLDVYPRSWQHVEGLQQEVEHRQRKLAKLQEEGVLFLPFEQRMTRDMQQRRDRRTARRLKGVSAPSLGSSGSEAWPGSGLGSDTSKASLLQDIPSGPSDALGLQGEVEMIPQSKMIYADELEHLDAAPKRQRGMVRSNSIVF